MRRPRDCDTAQTGPAFIRLWPAPRHADEISRLVRLLKDGTPRVTKKDLQAKYGKGKAVIVRETRNHPEILANYRRDKRRRTQAPLTHDELAHAEGSPRPQWAALLAAVTSVPAGRPDADAYEKAIADLLTALFYPSLTNPQIQHEIHGGRKRIDITYTNVGRTGFFQWLSRHYAAPHVFIECKNYSSDPANPELDQLAGRFSPSRGQFGLLICRSFSDKDLFVRRCRDTASDARGYIIALDDSDLATLVDLRTRDESSSEFAFLKSRFDQLIM